MISFYSLCPFDVHFGPFFAAKLQNKHILTTDMKQIGWS